MTFTNVEAEMNWIGKKAVMNSRKGCAAIMNANHELADKITKENDALIQRFITLGGTHYQLAGYT